VLFRSGTGDQPSATVPPPAGESNTDTGTGGSQPDTIPYARFKEVNDQLSGLRDYAQLRDLGYDPDSLGRLAAFEAAYRQDPVGTIAHLVSVNPDLPQETKDQVSQMLSDTPVAGGVPTESEGAKSALSPEDRELLDYAKNLREREQQAEVSARNDAVLNSVVAAWKRMDEADSLKSPAERVMLTQIAGVAGSGQYRNADELAKAARDSLLEYRSEVLGDAIQRTGRNGNAPAPLPGSRSAASEPVRFDSIKSATKAARESIERGELPPLSGE